MSRLKSSQDSGLSSKIGTITPTARLGAVGHSARVLGGSGVMLPRKKLEI